ncbi:MAG: hypothetical protein M3R45_15780 [Pseudomonadota bacterium]|nr:hypothetical protein [Pseudomonadota bacterium]
MAISKTESQKMQLLAQEGKKISKIVKEDFPSLTYWDVYFEIYGSGEKSSLGIKRTITNRINSVVNSTSKKERTEIAEEINNLVWHLYNNHKANQTKIAAIRGALGE